MKELIEKWRREAISMGRAQRNSTAYALNYCADELEAALKPRPIEEAKKGGEWLAQLKQTYIQSWGVLEYCVDDKRWYDEKGDCWDETEIVALFPLPSDGGKSDE